jgi:hypothetical protein
MAITVAACLFVGGILSWEFAARLRAEPQASPADELSIGPVQKFKNLAIFPVVSRGRCDADKYITLDEGLLSGKVKVFEVGVAAAATTQAAPAAQGQATQALQTTPVAGQVNRLVVTNESGKPLYLMPGETITGGKQDRTLAQSLVIANDGKPVEVNVFCVEHGRWALRSEGQTAQLAASLYGLKTDAKQTIELSKAAAGGQLVLGGTTVTKDNRLQINAGSTQSDVWDNVAKINVATGNLSSSGAYTENFFSKDVTDKFQPYVTALEKSVAGTERIVGVVVAVDGRIELADVFESTPLFRKLWPKLLKSYALDALGSAKPDDKACADGEALAFLKQAQSAAVEKSDQQPGVIVVTRSSDRVASFSCAPADAASAKEPAKPVHTATFAK